MTRSTRAVLALLVALVAPGCAARTETTVDGPAPASIVVRRGPVLVIGDSITVGARDFGGLAELLEDDGWQPEIVAESARTVAWGLEQIETRAEVPRTVVVALGSNPGPGLGTFPEEAAALVDALRDRGARRILWVPPAHVDAERYAERVGALLAMERPGFEVIEWPARVGPHPEWFHTDGLHLSAEGYAALASFIRDALAGRA